MEPPFKRVKICHGCRNSCLSQKDHIGGCLSRFNFNREIELNIMIESLLKSQIEIKNKYPDVAYNPNCPLVIGLAEARYELLCLCV